MHPIQDTWTHTHDLALVFLALGYSADRHLSDEEIDAIANALARWNPKAGRDEINEIVLESVAIFLESDPEKEVVQSVRSLGEALSLEKRREALEDVVRIAEADGVLLNAEQNLLSILADVWHIRATKERLLLESIVSVEAHPDWSLLHDLALLHVMIAHGADETLSPEELTEIGDRLGAWAPEMDATAVREILRTALQFYGSDPTTDELRGSVDAIAAHLPKSQRLVVLHDLLAVAAADGPVTPAERDLIESVSARWSVDIRVTE